MNLKDRTITDIADFPEKLKDAEIIRDANDHRRTFIRKDVFGEAVTEYIEQLSCDSLFGILKKRGRLQELIDLHLKNKPNEKRP